MKITPLDIQQQQFRMRFRGFDMVEVDNFLDLLAGEFEELLKEVNQLKEEDRRKLSRIAELEAVERDLRETLVSVQRITEEMKNNARKEAELIIEDAKTEARKIVQHGQAEALKVEEEINALKRQRGQFEATLVATLEMHRKLLETNQDRAKEPPPAEES
jgi:cell division initiation protein